MKNNGVNLSASKPVYFLQTFYDVRSTSFRNSRNFYVSNWIEMSLIFLTFVVGTRWYNLPCKEQCINWLIAYKATFERIKMFSFSQSISAKTDPESELCEDVTWPQKWLVSSTWKNENEIFVIDQNFKSLLGFEYS